MKKRIKFSKEFKLKAVHLSEKSDNIQDVADKFGNKRRIALSVEKRVF
jgi:transposase-like protein